MRDHHNHGGRRILAGFARPIGIALTPSILLLCCHLDSARAQGAASQAAPATAAQSPTQLPTLTIERLTAAVAQAQEQIEANQKLLLELRRQLDVLRLQMASAGTPIPAPIAPSAGTAAIASAPLTLDEVRERQAIAESQLATLDASKVETQSKYPLKISGLLLFNGFVNSRQVDVSAAPAYAIPGPGSTGLSLRQTVLGLDARGPHFFNATSRADLRVDFFASGAQSDYAAGGLLRLRTAHAILDWPNTEAFVELDRSILEPNEPTSLVAIAQPELAWAGNLWNWDPQVGVSHRFAISDSAHITAQAALIDATDPNPPNVATTSTLTQTERSRLPGTEAHIAFSFGNDAIRPVIGIGGYFSPQRNEAGDRFDAWAGTLDFRTPLTRHFEVTANAHRGQALAGLGAGGYVNYYYTYSGRYEVARALDDVGGWAQLKARASQRVEINAGFGSDNPFAKEIDAALPSGTAAASSFTYPGLARNRSFYSNVIFSPSAYLLFSLEYKRLWTSYATGPTSFSDSIGIGAGYKF